VTDAAEAEHGDGIAGADRELVECPVRGDAGAEQWGGLDEVEALRNVISVC